MLNFPGRGRWRIQQSAESQGFRSWTKFRYLWKFRLPLWQCNQPWSGDNLCFASSAWTVEPLVVCARWRASKRFPRFLVPVITCPSTCLWTSQPPVATRAHHCLWFGLEGCTFCQARKGSCSTCCRTPTKHHWKLNVSLSALWGPPF